MKNYVGIDGGGTKTDFKVVDENGSEILSLSIKQGSKPSIFGVDGTTEVLEQGLDQLSSRLDGGIDTIYAGIAGCTKPRRDYEPINQLLARYTGSYKLGDDLETNFKSLSAKPYGVALLAGTGSAISNWYPGGMEYLGRICYGVRGVTILLANAQKQKPFSKETARLLKRHMGSILGKNAYYLLTNPVPSHILEHFNQENVPEPVWKELEPVFNIVVERWAFESIDRIIRHQKITDDRPTEVILSGGLWNFEYIRESVLRQITQAFEDSIVIRFDPSIKAVDGAALLAKELSDSPDTPTS